MVNNFHSRNEPAAQNLAPELHNLANAAVPMGPGSPNRLETPPTMQDLTFYGNKDKRDSVESCQFGVKCQGAGGSGNNSAPRTPVEFDGSNTIFDVSYTFVWRCLTFG